MPQHNPIWTRRALLKSGIAATATVIAPEIAFSSSRGEVADDPSHQETASTHAPPGSSRERLLLDFNWRFHLGSACDVERDFNFGKLAREATFAKSGRPGAATYQKFDDSAWRYVDLPR